MFCCSPWLLGYAPGILFLSPLGYKYDRRTIILSKVTILTLALVLCGLVNDIGFLLVARLAWGNSAKKQVPSDAPPTRNAQWLPNVIARRL